MRKLSVLLAALMLGGLLSAAVPASAEKVTTDAATVAVAEEGYLIVADGNSGNQYPFGGYVGVTDAGGIDCDDDGGPYDDAGEPNVDHEAGGGCP